MATKAKKTKTPSRKVGKLIKVAPDLHHKLKVSAAQSGTSIGEHIRGIQADWEAK